MTKKNKTRRPVHKKFFIGIVKLTEEGMEDVVMVIRNDPELAYSCYQRISNNTCGMLPFIKNNTGEDVIWYCKSAGKKKRQADKLRQKIQDKK